jgi:hypothetical protein
MMWFRALHASPPPNGIKGWSTLMRWPTVNRANFLDTLDNKQWVYVGNVWVPWDGITAPQN